MIAAVTLWLHDRLRAWVDGRYQRALARLRDLEDRYDVPADQRWKEPPQ